MASLLDKSVILYIDHLSYGGAQLQFLIFYKYLISNGVSVKLLSHYAPNSSLLSEINPKDLTIIHSTNKFLFIFMIARYILKSNAEFVFSYGYLPSLYSAISRLFSQSTTIFMDRGSYKTRAIPFVFYIYLLFVPLAKIVVVNNIEQKFFYKRLRFLLRTKIFFLPNSYTVLPRIQISSCYPSTSSLKIVSIGRIDPDKGYPQFISHISKWCQIHSFVNLTYSIVGHTTSKQEFMRINKISLPHLCQLLFTVIKISLGL